MPLQIELPYFQDGCSTVWLQIACANWVSTFWNLVFKHEFANRCCNLRRQISQHEWSTASLRNGFAIWVARLPGWDVKFEFAIRCCKFNCQMSGFRFQTWLCKLSWFISRRGFQQRVWKTSFQMTIPAFQNEFKNEFANRVARFPALVFTKRCCQFSCQIPRMNCHTWVCKMSLQSEVADFQN